MYFKDLKYGPILKAAFDIENCNVFLFIIYIRQYDLISLLSMSSSYFYFVI